VGERKAQRRMTKERGDGTKKPLQSSRQWGDEHKLKPTRGRQLRLGCRSEWYYGSNATITILPGSGGGEKKSSM